MNDQLSDYDFDLPEAQIALHPAAPRESAKLLHVQASGALSHHHVGDLPQLLRPGDLMVFNDTQVVPGRLDGVRQRGDLEIKVEATLVERLSPSEYLALMKPGRRLKPGDRVVFGDLGAELLSKGEVGDATLRFDLAGEALDQAIDRLGQMPLPPYIAGKRAPNADDRRDYQTIYARERGSAAAPTAGLHFTEALLARLRAEGVNSAFVTLHVGLGTFLPVKVENLNDHVMHAEFGVIPESTRQAVLETRARGGRIVAVGTTALRLLESAADEHGNLSPFCGKTEIFIRPGYRFKCADLLMTNFHLPKSTLFMLVSAFSGLETMRAAYAEAIAHGYRFYSYGDASLLELRPL